jgi:hypothetical protein
MLQTETIYFFSVYLYNNLTLAESEEKNLPYFKL